MNADDDRTRSEGRPYGELEKQGVHWVLLTGIGTKADESTYKFEERTTRQPLSCLALLDVLPVSFDEIVAVCTSTAEEETFPTLEREMKRREKPPLVEALKVPDAMEANEIECFVEKVAKRLAAKGQDAPRTRLVVDLTQGFRHQSLLMYVTTLYLTALGRVDVERVFYCAQGSPGAIIDLTPLIHLPLITHAVRVARETGSTRALARVIPDIECNKGARESLEAIARHLLAGLALEVGVEWGKYRRLHEKQVKRSLMKGGVPLVEELVNDLRSTLDRLSVNDDRCYVKSNVELNEAELRRQAKLIDALFDWEMDWSAIGLLREWTVSWALWCGAGEPRDLERWLAKERRQAAEHSLHALSRLSDDPQLKRMLSREQLKVAEFWQAVCELRNSYMHFGMRPGWVDARKRVQGSNLHKLLGEVRKRWEDFRGCPCIRLLPEQRVGRVLVTAHGRSPGVLTNAIRQASREDDCLDHVVIISSEESKATIDEAIHQSGWEGEPRTVIVRDPYDPIAVADLVRGQGDLLLPDHPEIRELLTRAEEIVVNLTGGTTAMMLGVQLTAESAKQYQPTVRRFLLADRRAPEEQHADPWAPCDVVWL